MQTSLVAGSWTLRVAARIFTPAGQAFGILIINIDLTSAFAAIHSEIRPGDQVYVVNENGDYLLHPEQHREFGFEFGRPAHIQDDFPDAASMLMSFDKVAPRPPWVIQDRNGVQFGMGWETARLAGATRVSVVPNHVL